MQHTYYQKQPTTEHQPRMDHSHEVRHRNQWGATITTRHYSEGDAIVEKERVLTAHGYRAIIRAVKPSAR